jgi:preprotein translocase subunit YajC
MFYYSRSDQMKINKIIALTALGLAAAPLAAQDAAPAAAAAAPAAASVAAGAKVFDAQGGEVGTVDSVTNGVAVVNTGTNKVGLPLASFGAGASGPTISMTKAELDTAASQAAQKSAADLKAQLATGATVYGRAGETIGTIKAADAEFVTITRPKGEVKLPITAFGKGDKGVMISMTVQELDQAMASAAPATPAK